MVPVRQSGADVEAYRASTEAAALCKEIVIATSSEIQKRRYVSVEGWQAIAVAHGCAASARDVEKVEGGVRAIGEVHRMSDGQLIAAAEGFVGEDEPTWYGGTMKRWKWGQKRGEKIWYDEEMPKRPDYAIRAMAQTRAISRACRSAFAHVVVMMNAGLATTPAEEMVGLDIAETIDGETGEVIDTGERERTPPPPGITKIKNNLNKFMREGNKCTDIEAFRALVKANKDDLKTIRDAKHSYWTGDGEDHEGFEKWMERRYAELTPKTESLGFQFLCSCIQESKSVDDLRSLMDQHASAIDELDGEESRRFETLYNEKEAALASPTPLTVGVFGG
jgi:hypothetical protein